MPENERSAYKREVKKGGSAYQSAEPEKEKSAYRSTEPEKEGFMYKYKRETELRRRISITR